ncbi:MAG TPA: cytochrome C oxidase subunit IV family protein [Herpetosiphonaceae bacterium]
MGPYEQRIPREQSSHHDPMVHHIIPVRTYLLVFGVLFVLFILTVVVAFFDLGLLNFVVAISIAAAKAVLIILYFMHVRYSSRMTWVFAGAAFVWLALMLGMTMADYISRSWLPIYR